MRNRHLFFLLFFLPIFLHTFSQSAVCAYKYRKRITFNPAQVSGSSDLVSFTALINISTDNDLRTVGNAGHVQNANGYDIIFTSYDGVTKLDHQLERYTASNGELVAWVRIPLLSTSINTYIYMYYGNTAITADQSVDATWNSAYKGVWHLNNSLVDGTASNNDGVTGGTTSSNTVTAKIAGGRVFSGAGTNYVQLPLAGSSATNGCVSLWGRMASYTASRYFFGMSTTQNGGYANRMQLYLDGGTANLVLGIGGAHVLQNNVEAITVNTWYHIAYTWSATASGVGNYTIYVNGVNRGTGTYSAFSAMHTFADIGNDGNAGQRTEELNGQIDEVHVTNTTLSGDWIITEYNNQNSPSTFYTISTEPKVWDGSASNSFNTAANWAGNASPGATDDVILEGGMPNQPVLQANQQINSVFIRSAATLSLSNRNFAVRADITNCGVLYGGTGILILNSATGNVQTQYLSGSGTFTLNDLTVSNTFSPNPSVMLNKNVDMDGDLILTSGIVYTSTTNILSLGTGATSTSGSASSFVSGPVSKAGNTSFVFPVGKGTRWRRAGVSGITAPSTFRAEYFNAAYTSTTPVNAPLDNVSSLEYWQIDRLSGTGNANVSLYWEAADQSGINNCTDLTIARWSGTAWDERAGTSAVGSNCSTGTGTITTLAVVTAFSPFTFGSKLAGANPLPVELLSFDALCNGQRVKLSWSTVTEKDSRYFALGRSTDGNAWTDVAHVAAAGTSRTPKEYTYPDVVIPGELVYYRLTEVDAADRKKELGIRALQCNTEAQHWHVYPNPAAGELNIELNLPVNYGSGTLKITDNLGRTCFESKLELLKGLHIYPLSPDLPPGTYTVLLISDQLVLPAKKLLVK